MIYTRHHLYQRPDWSHNGRVEYQKSAIADFILPRNAVTGKRQFNLIPLRVEKLLGTCLFALQSRHLQASFERVFGSSSQNYQSIVDNITAKLTAQVPNCHGQPWPFKVTVIASNQVNAFAYPGGNIVITDQLIKNIYNYCQPHDNRILSSKGDATHPEAQVNVFGVQPEDMLAAIIGHEMTHICARHSSMAMTISCIAVAILAALMAVCIMAVEEYQKNSNTGHFSNFDSKMNDNNSADNVRELNAKLMHRCRQAFTYLINFGELWRSRRCEFEADKWGMIYAARANFDPRGGILAQEMLSRRDLTPKLLSRCIEWFTTHPLSERRIDKLIHEMMDRSKKCSASLTQENISNFPAIRANTKSKISPGACDFPEWQLAR